MREADGASGPQGPQGPTGATGADGAFAGRTITGTADQIAVTNGDGVAGDPTLSLVPQLTLSGTVATLELESTLSSAYANLFFTNDVVGSDWEIGVGGSAVTDDVDDKFFIWNGQTGFEDYALVVDGLNVGINTTAPDATLSVNGDASKSGGGS